MLTGRIYKFLNIGERPQPADAIFVLAGQQERKVYGIELWREGFAPELILSIGRFEWRRFYQLGLPSDGGLRRLVEATPPTLRHFFLRFHGNGANAQWIRRGRYGTLSEGQALAETLRSAPPSSLMVVSTSIHLRRVALVFHRAFRGMDTQLLFVAVPADRFRLRPAALWTELGKYLCYTMMRSPPPSGRQREPPAALG
jgi:uncharacterized SAM-binding protein YcdF (DUF218 family)